MNINSLLKRIGIFTISFFILNLNILFSKEKLIPQKTTQKIKTSKNKKKKIPNKLINKQTIKEIQEEKTLENFISTENNNKILIYLKTKPKLIFEEFNLLIEYSTKPNHFLVRRYLIDFLIKKNKTSYQETLYSLIHIEFKYQIHNINSDNQGIQYLTKLIQYVREKKEKFFFYDILTFIGYPLMSIRIESFKTLGALKDDRMFPILLQWTYSENPIERIYAIDALAYIKDDRMTNLLIQLLKDKHKSVRLYAINSLYKLKKTEAIPYFIRIVQSDVNTEVRVKAIQVLGDYKVRRAFYVLIRALSDSKIVIRKTTLEALLKYNNNNACFYISKQLVIEKDNDLKMLYIKALLKLKNSGGMAGLNKIMQKETNIKIRLWGIYATSVLKDFRGYNSLLSNLKSKNCQIKSEASFALGQMKNNKATQSLLNILTKEEEKYCVQITALHALQKINNENILPILFDLSENHHNILFRKQIKKTIKEILYKKFPYYIH